MAKHKKALKIKNIKTPPKIVSKEDFRDSPSWMKDEAEHMVKNGLSNAILGFDPGSIGTQLYQVDSLFINLRWYLISNMRQPLSEAYAEQGLIKTICDVPVDDALRGGVDIHSKQLSSEQVQDLQIYLERENILNAVVGQALKWNRLYGGAGVLTITDQPQDTPLNVMAIGLDTPLEFRAVDMWELFWDKQNVEGYNPETQQHSFEFYNYYGGQVHKTRVQKLVGITPPSFIRPRLRGWGLSEIEYLIAPINQWFKSNNLIFEILDEFKLDIFKIKNLASTLLSADGESRIKQRVQLANLQKNYQHALTMDSEDDYMQKQLTFSGLAEMKKEFRMDIACAMKMPITKIFGLSAQGFNSGEDDIENYNAMVESTIRSKCKFIILNILELVCQKKFGFIPDDLTIAFKPLRMLTSEQEENVKTQQFNRVMAALEKGAIDGMMAIGMINTGKLLPERIDPDMLSLASTEDTEDQAAEGPEGEGANKAFSEQSKSDKEPGDADEPQELDATTDPRADVKRRDKGKPAEKPAKETGTEIPGGEPEGGEEFSSVIDPTAEEQAMKKKKTATDDGGGRAGVDPSSGEDVKGGLPTGKKTRATGERERSPHDATLANRIKNWVGGSK